LSFLQYLGLLFLSLSWFWSLPIYKSTGIFWLPLVIAGIVLLSFPPRSMRLVTHYLYRGGGTEPANRIAGGDGRTGMGRLLPAARFSKVSALLLIPLLIALFTLPRPLAPGLLILVLAIAGGVWIGEGGGTFRPVTGSLLGGAVLAIQGFALPLLAVFSAHVHNVPLFGYIIYPFVRLFEHSAAISGGRIYVASLEEIFGFGVSMEKLAFLPIALFCIAVVVSRVFNADALRSLGRMLLALIVFAAVRFILVFFAVVLSSKEFLFWDPRAILLSLLPVALVMAWILPYRVVPLAGSDREETARGGTPVKAALIFTAAFFLLVGSIVFHDPGRMKRGRVLFDEKYSDWEWSTQVYDRDWYGSKSGYNYYCLFEYIKHFYDVEQGSRPFTPDYLEQYDVVIIKTPTMSFTAEEIDALVAYVRRGGGLFLIGDHTNVFGTSTNLNPIASRFGLRFNYDSTYELHTMALTNYTSPPLIAHPAMVHVPEFFWATSCSMDSPLFGENVIVANNLRGVYLDYSRRSFFPSKDEKEYEFGFLMQMAGVKAGKGRVLGHTDSTVFSNFFMFIPGKPESFLYAIDWLNRTNRWHRLNLVLFILGTLAAVLGARSLGGAGRLQASGAVLFGLTLGLVLSVHIFDALKKSAYPELRPKREMKTIAFDRDPSFNEMPLKSLVRNREVSLHTFYVWTQRLGFVPSLHPTLEQSLAASNIAVVANPRRSLTIDEVDAVVDFIRGGGNLLLIIEPRFRTSGANDFLGIFRMSTAGAIADTTEILNIRGEKICDAFYAGTINGGRPLLTLPGGRVVFAYNELGKGRLFAFADFYLFSQAVMGPTSITPNRGQREVFELEYQILEILTGEREPDDIRPYMAPSRPGIPSRTADDESPRFD
jgi:hypothetical protein